MARREVGEINAGSMADIAFLLLIFFLVTTTMDTDEGIVRTLPQKLPPDYKFEIEVRERDVFEVLANANDQLLVENQYKEIDDLKDMAKEFLTNPTNREDLPAMFLVNKSIAQAKIDSIQTAIANPDVDPDFLNIMKEDLKDWEEKLIAAEKAGSFYSASKFAMISLRNDNGTSYKLYVQVQDELQAAINELRDEWAQKIYQEKYTDWDPLRKEDQEKIRVIRAIVPQRIAEQQPANIPAY